MPLEDMGIRSDRTIMDITMHDREEGDPSMVMVIIIEFQDHIGVIPEFGKQLKQLFTTSMKFLRIWIMRKI